MHLLLGNVHVQLSTSSSHLQTRWVELFGASDNNVAQHTSLPELSLYLDVVPSVSPPAEATPIFTDKRGIVSVYRDERERFWLYFHAGALIELELAAHQVSDHRTLYGTIIPEAVDDAHLEDITFTALAPLLRRHQHYLLHGAAVQWNGQAILFVGPSGSGKTTTSLALLLAGSKYLTSDLIILARTQGDIYAYPTPHILKVRKHTLTLLPGLQEYGEQFDKHERRRLLRQTGVRALRLNAHDLAPASPVSAIYFPCLGENAQSEVQPLPDALALAHLMGESVDRWDSQALEAHLDFLAKLGRQCQHYALNLGTDVATLPDLLLRQLSA